MRSAELYERAQKVIAGGVSSDARRSAYVPLYVDRAQGAHLWDADGNEYVDYVLAQGPMVLGHTSAPVVEAVSRQLTRGHAYAAQHELEVIAAELVGRLVPNADLVRFNTVGSEAVIGAWRIARGATGRQKIIKFEGHYHGWLDSALWSLHPAVENAGPAQTPRTVPGTGGQQLSSGTDLIVAPWNDPGALTALMAEHGSEVAAIVMEPVLCNTGCISPVPGFLDTVQALCTRHGSLLIFDEVITGFRLAPGGAQEYLGVTPDLAVFGKAIAGGLPVAAITGKAAIMDYVTRGDVGHAGTFNSNPLGMAATVGNLSTLDRDREQIYPHLYAMGKRLIDGIRAAAASAGVPMLVDGPGPMFQTYLTGRDAIRDYRDFATTDRAAAARFHRALQTRGINIVPRGLWFLSAAHTPADIDRTLETVAEALREVY